MRFLVIQFSAYLTEFRRALLQSRYGVAIRNLIFVKPDKKLYFVDNSQNEFCLSHPAWTNVSGKPTTFTPSTHNHPYAGEAHNHDWAEITGEPATYPPEAHGHDWADVTNKPSTFPPETHNHQRIVGEIVLWPIDGIPSGWLICNGQAVSRSTYVGLFTIIGTIYGTGNGSTTFNVPDLRGRFPLGQDDMGGSSANRVTATEADNLGQGSGAETHTLTTSEIPSHSHNPGSGSYFLNNTASGTLSLPAGAYGFPSSATTATAGGGGTHNNMPPYLTLNFIIYAGV